MSKKKPPMHTHTHTDKNAFIVTHALTHVNASVTNHAVIIGLVLKSDHRHFGRNKHHRCRGQSAQHHCCSNAGGFEIVAGGKYIHSWLYGKMLIMEKKKVSIHEGEGNKICSYSCGNGAIKKTKQHQIRLLSINGFGINVECCEDQL